MAAQVSPADLYVMGLPESYTDADLVSLLADVGQVVQMTMLQVPDDSKRQAAFVRMASKEQARYAYLSLQGRPLCADGHPLEIQLACVVNFLDRGQPQVHQDDPSGEAAILNQMADLEQELQGAFQAQQFERCGEIREELRRVAAAYPGRRRGPGSAVLYCSNLPSEYDETTLAMMFSAFGDVLAVSMPKDPRTKTRKGYAFIDMADADQAARAIDTFDGYPVGNKIMHVKFK
ncbi:RRM domain-containing protein [Plasmodiophora brassicae]|nr:hypothetical protein PBRA_003535 [Plasmodiophora brassicae]